ncbi:MAG TPA: glycosyltransferase family 1 protein [Chloroflexi bacterium]|nr:glycosyltransferase family 1 protein [Chloroflexota bacterium]
MKILTVLTYYRPHTSGLTIYVERLARTLVQRGHEVTVLTSQFEPDLPREEIVNGVRIVRVPVWFRISKGVMMPTFGFLAWKLALEHDVIHLHLPQFDAAGVALRGRLLRKPTVITYHCDLELPSGLFNRFVNAVVLFMNNLAGRFTHRIGAYTDDFAHHSPYLQYFAKKVRVILPPVELPKISEQQVAAFQQQHNPEQRAPVIGMATRFASEKGVEILLGALPQILERHPQAMVLYAGQYQGVWGEEDYLARLLPTIEKYQAAGQWKFLGNLTPEQIAAFYPNLDVLVVPSLNSTETFGLVQIEAMINGTPTVASNLPGVRQPPLMTGMGEVVPIGDAPALAEAILKIFAHPENYAGDPPAIERQFSPQANAAAYEDLYQELMKELGNE